MNRDGLLPPARRRNELPWGGGEALKSVYRPCRLLSGQLSLFSPSSDSYRPFRFFMAPSTIRKAIGAVKDQTSIGLAKVWSNLSPELEIAIVKATSHDDEPSDEKHIREILNLSSYSLGYANACVTAISRRLSKTRDWIVALKTLMLVHRLLADGDPAFQHELHRITRLLSTSGFRDEAHSNSWDHSAFVRTYALYLDQRLESIIEPEKILERLHQLQHLLDQFLACRPTGLAKNSRIVLVALYPILKESFQLYADICETLSLLLDRFFDMDYADCVNVFEAYAGVAKQIDELSAFYAWCKDSSVARPTDFPEVQRITATLLETLEEFTRDRARQPKCKPEKQKLEEEEEEELMPKRKPEKPPLADLADLVDLREDSVTADSSNGNKLDLALFSTGGVGTENADWEVTLMETASNLAKQEATLGGGFDYLLLNGMYDLGEVSSSRLNTTMPVLALPAPDGTEQAIGQDPFAASLSIPPASYVQMADIDRKQQMLLQEQQMWQQYASHGMQGQASLTMLNNAYFYANSAMPYGMQTTTGYYYPSS